jgi:hypothetical protein
METQYILTESELLEILEDRCTLAALEAAGVDNWEGYDFAFEDFEEDGIEKEAKDCLNNYEKFN